MQNQGPLEVAIEDVSKNFLNKLPSSLNDQLPLPMTPFHTVADDLRHYVGDVESMVLAQVLRTSGYGERIPIREALNYAFPNTLTLVHDGLSHYFIEKPIDAEYTDEDLDRAKEAVTRNQEGEFGPLRVVAQLDPKTVYSYQDDYCVQPELTIESGSDMFTYAVWILKRWDFMFTGRFLVANNGGVMAIDVVSPNDPEVTEWNLLSLEPF